MSYEEEDTYLPTQVTVMRPVDAAFPGIILSSMGRSYEYASVTVAGCCPLVSSTRRVALEPPGLAHTTVVEESQKEASAAEFPTRTRTL